jgi:serine/threonine protein kinase/Tol biopolymer transport system component
MDETACVNPRACIGYQVYNCVPRMALTSGTKLGPYEILSPLGAGGMGEVYRARDTRLERTVAIKVLPANLTADPNLRQRLEREAKAVSKLSHPNICTLHDLGHQDGVDFLVMELVEGDTLEQRLLKGPLPPEQTLRFAAQIADALAKAHKLGITHRDLKPSNVMLAKAGAKLMDFGLAKDSGTAPLAEALTEMTAANRLTGEGTIVGTFQYMAPEQLEGKEADARTDIFALGEVIYEMATGQPAFAGKSRASLIAAILTTDPPSLCTLQPMTPPGLERVVKKCLAKDPDERWQSASDLASELAWIAQTSSGSQAGASVPVLGKSTRRPLLAWVAAAVAGLTAIAFAAAYFANQKPERVVRSQIVAPGKLRFNFVGDNGGPLAISPDGSHIVFSATEDGKTQLYLRAQDSIALQPLPGTEDATFPFWSPDSRSVAFFAGRKLKRIDIAGGPPVTLCDAPTSRGGSWGSAGIIIFAPTFSSSLFQVPTSGGTAVEVTKLDAKYTTHRWPWFLPDGKHFLYLAANHNAPSGPDTGIFLASLDGKQNRLLFLSRANAIYASGSLLFLRDTALVAQPFDPSSGQLKGDPTVLNDDVQSDPGVWRGTFTASDNGTLIYQPGLTTSGLALTWIDRSGKELGTVGGREIYQHVRLSPDDQKLALSIGDPQAAIWIHDLVHNTRTRLTFGTESYGSLAWSPDGSHLGYTASEGGNLYATIFSKAATGAGESERLLAAAHGQEQALCDWSPDGRYLIYRSGSAGPGGGQDLWILPLFGDRKPFPYVTGPGDQREARFSPDGRWVAYTSNETGRLEVYVAPFPWTGAKWQVSANGGYGPEWRRDGKELFFLIPGASQFVAAAVYGSGTSFEVGELHTLFRTSLSPSTAGTVYAPTRDGQRFIAITAGEEGSMPLNLVQNWTAELKKK